MDLIDAPTMVDIAELDELKKRLASESDRDDCFRELLTNRVCRS